MSLTAERVNARRKLRAILAGREDDEMARAFATYRTELAELLGDPAATTLSKRGQGALARISERTLATRGAIAKVQPRVHEANVLLRAFEGYHRGLHDLRVAFHDPLTPERLPRFEHAAHVLQRSGKLVEHTFEELRG
jgi:hypothetical protein